jgi:hypothetical protein
MVAEGMDTSTIIHPYSLAPVDSSHQSSQWRVNVEQQNDGGTGSRQLNRPSFVDLVDFLGQRSALARSAANPVVVTELVFNGVVPLEDGGLDVLGDFLANDATTTLNKISFVDYDLAGGKAGVLLRSLRNNNTVQELQLSNCQLTDADLCILADALDGNTTLNMLDLSHNLNFSAVGVGYIIKILTSTQVKKIKFGLNDGAVFNDKKGLAAQRLAHVLRENTCLQSLELDVRSLPSRAAVMLFQALEFNITLQELLFPRLIHFTGEQSSSQQCVTVVVDQLVQSLPRMTGIQRLSLDDWDFCLQHPAFLSALNQNASLQHLLGISDQWSLPGQRLLVAKIRNVLERNRSLTRVDFLLLAPPSQPPPPTTAGSSILGGMDDDSSYNGEGVWHEAIVKLAQCSSADNASHVGASAIYKILQAQVPLLLSCNNS